MRVAPGELVTLLCGNVEPTPLSLMNVISRAPGNAAREQTTVMFDGISETALLAAGGRVLVRAPGNLRPQTTVDIRFRCAAVETVLHNVPVQPSMPALLTTGGAGRGPVIAINADGTSNAPTNPAALGSTITVLATGTGSVPDSDAAHWGAANAPLDVSIAGIVCPIVNVSASAMLRGVELITFTLSGLQEFRGAVPLTIAAKGVLSQEGTFVFVDVPGTAASSIFSGNAIDGNVVDSNADDGDGFSGPHGQSGEGVRTNTVEITAGAVSFTQQGVGSVSRSVQSKLQDVLSVMDFGAVGDGVTDDTKAIQAAFNAAVATSGRVRIPATRGGYRVSSTLNVPRGLTIKGENYADPWTGSTQSRILTVASNIPVLSIVDTVQDGSTTDVSVSDLLLDCNGKPGSTGVQVGGTQAQKWTTFVRLENVWGYNCSAASILIREAWNVRLINVRTSGPGSGLRIDPLTTTSTILIEGGHFGPHPSGQGVYITGASASNHANIRLHGVIIEGCASPQIAVARPVQALSFDDIYIEGPTAVAMDLSGQVKAVGGIFGNVDPGPVTVTNSVLGGTTAIYSSVPLLGGLTVSGNTSTATTFVNIPAGSQHLVFGPNSISTGAILLHGVVPNDLARPSVQAISTKTVDYTLTTEDVTVLADCGGGPLSLTLPPAPMTGEMHNLKLISGSGPTTVIGNGFLIDGSTQLTLTPTRPSVRLQYDGSQWRTL